MSPARPALAVVVTVLAGACGDAEPPADDATAGADTVQATEAPSGPTACDLVAEQALEDVLGLALEPGRITRSNANESQCRWPLPDDAQRGVSISLRALSDLSLYENVPGASALGGVGDAAVWNAEYGQLAVLRGERVVSVSLLIDDAQRAQAERIARAALAGLDSAQAAAAPAAAPGAGSP